MIDVLTAHGFHVTRISGAGVPDLLVSHRAHGGRCWVVEVKTPKGRSKAAQIAFGTAWQGEPIAILRSVEDAIRWAQGRR